jgi:hypothetical protein
MKTRLALILLTAALLAAACGEVDTAALLADGDNDVSDAASATTAPDRDDDPPTPAAPPTGDGNDEIAGTPAGIRGTLSSPVPAGRIADVGGGWKVQVLGVEADATATVLEENPFNDPPPDRSVFTLVRVRAGYYGTEDPVDWFDLSISALENSLELDGDCGIVPDDFPFAKVYAGGTIEGNVCFVSSGDPSELTVFAEQFFSFDDERVFLEVGPPATVETMPALRGPQPGAAASAGRLDPIAAGTPTVIGADWTVSVGAGRVGTGEVLSAYDFNDAPPAGNEFYLVDIDLTYTGAETGSSFDLDIGAVAASNITLDTFCGVIDNDFDFTQEVFPGGTLSGTACFIVPSEETDTVVVTARQAFDFDAVDFYFAPG